MIHPMMVYIEFDAEDARIIARITDLLNGLGSTESPEALYMRAVDRCYYYGHDLDEVHIVTEVIRTEFYAMVYRGELSSHGRELSAAVKAALNACDKPW